MKPQHFVALSIAAIASFVLAALVVSNSRPWTAGSAAGRPLMPGLAAKADQVAAIEIRRGEHLLTLERKDGHWKMRERGGFEADAERVRALFTALTGSTLADAKTRNPERYGMLEVDEVKDGKSGAGRLLRLLDKDGAVIGEVIVGKARLEAFGSGKPGTYVRTPGEAQSYLATGSIDAGTRLADWASARIVDVPTAKVSRMTVEVAGDAPYAITRDGEQHKLMEMPPGKKLRFVNTVDGLVEQATFVEFDDARKAASDGGGAPAGTVTVETDDGLKLVLTVRRDKDGAWLGIKATGDGAAKATAETMSRRAEGWEFKILPSKADGLLKKRDELIEDAPA